MTQKDLIEFQPGPSAFSVLADKFTAAMEKPELLDAAICPAVVRASEHEARENHKIVKFDTEKPFVQRAEYAGNLLFQDDKYEAGKSWKLVWGNTASMPTLTEGSTLPLQLTPKSASDVRDSLWARRQAIVMMNSLNLPEESRATVIEGWQGREGITAGFSKSLVSFLSLYELAKKGDSDAVDKFFEDYYWKSSLLKTGPEKKTRDPVNYRVAAVLVLLAQNQKGGISEDDFNAILDKFKILNTAEKQRRTEAVKLYEACIAADSYEPLLNQNARIVGRIYMQAYFGSRLKELQANPEENVNAYARTLGEMVLFATLKVTPDSPLFTKIQEMSHIEVDAIITAVFNPNLW